MTSLPPASTCDESRAAFLNEASQKYQYALGEGTEVVGGKVEIACSSRRRADEAQEEEGEPTAAAAVGAFLAQNQEYVARLRHAALDDETVVLMKKLLQDFGQPALV